MLYWKADFQIPDSGAQSAEVFAFCQLNDEQTVITVEFYADNSKQNLLFIEQYEHDSDYVSAEEYLLTTEEFANYTLA